MGKNNLLVDYIRIMVEASRIREADVSDGGRVPWGSTEHIEDLIKRIDDLTRWRDKQKKGSEARANYTRVISKLKSELKSARNKLKKNEKVTLDES